MTRAACWSGIPGRRLKPAGTCAKMSRAVGCTASQADEGTDAERERCARDAEANAPHRGARASAYACGRSLSCAHPPLPAELRSLLDELDALERGASGRALHRLRRHVRARQ